MSSAIGLILMACLLSGAPHGVCKAEIVSGAVVDDFQVRVEVPFWATLVWQDYAAHIVASEARNVPAADIVIACTILRDIERGHAPWNLKTRWFGYGPPDEADRQAVEDALFTGGCEAIPHYRYVGSFKDAQYWRTINMIGEGPFDLFIGPTGSAVVGVP